MTPRAKNKNGLTAEEEDALRQCVDEMRVEQHSMLPIKRRLVNSLKENNNG